MEQPGGCWECFRSEFGVSDLFLKHLLKGGVMLLVCLLLSTQTLQWTDSTAEEWPEKYLLAFSVSVGWDVSGEALTTEACTKQRSWEHVAETGREKGGCLFRQFYTMGLMNRRREEKTCPVYFLLFWVVFFPVLNSFVHLLLYLDVYLRSVLRHCP